MRAPRARRGLRALVAVGAALASAERDLQRFAADHLEPLKSAAQLPTLAVEDLMEVFTLRTEVVIPSMLEPVTVSMEHYALAFRLNSVDWDRARTGADVTSVHFLPRNVSALLGLPVFGGANGTGAASWPDATGEVLVTKAGHNFDFDLWQDADYIGTVGGRAFARLAEAMPSYGASGGHYSAFEVYGAMPVNDDLFVQWCLERLGEAGATLTPLMRPERRRLKLHARQSPTLAFNANPATFATSVRDCVIRKADAGAGSARWPLRQLVNEASSPLSACLAAMPTGALFRSKDGEQSRVLLETPFVSYEPYEPVTPKPSKKRYDDSLDRTWIDVVLLMALVAGCAFGAYALLKKAGCLLAYKAKGREILRGRAGNALRSDDVDLYARLQSERHGANTPPRAQRAQTAPAAPDEAKESQAALV